MARATDKTKIADLKNLVSSQALPVHGTPDVAISGAALANIASLAESALQSGDNVSELANDAGYLTSISGEAIGSLSNVNISSVADGNILTYDAGAAEWINETLAQAGIAAVGHTHILADITDSGTMASQDADSVAITGGAINGTVIGGNTAAAGTFTTLTVNTSLTIQGGQSITEVSTDETLADDSDSALPTEQAVKGYVDANAGGGGAPIAAMMDYAGASAPSGWLFANGETIGDAGSGADNEDSGYQVLFNLIKDSWGNAGTEDFAGGDTVKLPDFRGRSPMGSGTGAGLTARARGDSLGEEDHALTQAELASHSHDYAGRTLNAGDQGADRWSQSGTSSTELTGSDTPHNTIHPVLVAHRIIKAK